jgi:S-adenosylmethionine decarboxylase
MNGLHLTADLSNCQCDAAWLTDAARLGDACVKAVNEAGLQAVAQLFHTFPSSEQGAGGVTATVLTLDVYVCNYGGDHSAKARALMALLMQLFSPGKVAVNALERGAS